MISVRNLLNEQENKKSLMTKPCEYEVFCKKCMNFIGFFLGRVYEYRYRKISL